MVDETTVEAEKESTTSASVQTTTSDVSEDTEVVTEAQPEVETTSVPSTETSTEAKESDESTTMVVQSEITTESVATSSPTTMSTSTEADVSEETTEGQEIVVIEVTTAQPEIDEIIFTEGPTTVRSFETTTSEAEDSDISDAEVVTEATPYQIIDAEEDVTTAVPDPVTTERAAAETTTKMMVDVKESGHVEISMTPDGKVVPHEVETPVATTQQSVDTFTGKIELAYDWFLKQQTQAYFFYIISEAQANSN